MPAQGQHGSAEEILLDLNALAAGHKYLGLGAFAVSDDGNWLAYSTDTTGYRQYSLHLKDLRKGEILSENIERVGSVVWATDNKTLFYTTEDAVSKRSDKFWRHAVGAADSDLIYEEKSELFDLGAERSLDKKVIFLSSYAKTSTEVRYLPADTPGAPATVVLPREAEHEYVDHYNGLFYITTNKGAKNFKIVTAPINDPSEKNWTVFIDHNPAIKINGVSFFASHIVVSEREGGLTQLRIIDPKTRQSHRIATDEPDFALSLGSNPEFNTSTVRFNYQSMVTPSSVYDYDVVSRQRKLLKRQEVLGGYDPSRYEAARLWAVARDGTKVPISVVHRKGVALDGKAPLLLYGYGSYGASGAATFSSNRLSLLDRGVVFANAYVRGGGEMGEDWREQGRMMKKINTFNDFIDCAEHLVKSRYTSPDRLVIQGGSAGGLLVGTVANMRPDLFKAVVSQVPFVDVINTMLDASLPLTTSEYLEWGNPNEKPAFDYMMRVLAVQQRQAGELSGHAGAGVAQRQPGALLGRHEARGQAARHQDRQEHVVAESQHGRRSRRLVRPLRRAARDGVHLRIHAVADGGAGRRHRHVVGRVGRVGRTLTAASNRVRLPRAATHASVTAGNREAGHAS